MRIADQKDPAYASSMERLDEAILIPDMRDDDLTGPQPTQQPIETAISSDVLI